MNQEKKISVCLPFYNIEPYVSRCLDSVLDNTYQNLEVICVNDGSTDGTSALLHKYAKEDPRVIVIDKENGGLVSARQAAISIATGDFLSFIDGDDWAHPQFFEILLTVQEKTGALPLVLHGGTGIPADMIKKAISLGVSKINVNTECQLSFADATRKYIEAGKDLEGKGFDPRKLLAPGTDAIKATVKEKMELFGSVGKAE